MGNLGDYVFDNTLLMKLPHVHCLIPVFAGGCSEISAHHGAVRKPFLHILPRPQDRNSVSGVGSVFLEQSLSLADDFYGKINMKIKKSHLISIKLE